MRHLPLRMSACLILVTCLIHVDTAEASRYVRAQVVLDGKVILEGNASDDGQRNADQVWDALKTVTFKPTAEFQSLKIKADLKEVVVKSTSLQGEPSNLKIEVYYGGIAGTHELHLRRVPVDAYGREWQIDSRDVEDLFESRLISRREVGKLSDPKRQK